MSKSLRLGIFIAFTLLAAVAAIFLIGNKSFLFTRTYRLYAEFSEVAGLQGGAPVQVAGVQEGAVTQIYLPARPGQPVRVEMRLKNPTRQVVKKDSVAIVQTQGLVGDQFLQVSVGSAQSPSVSNGDTIQGRAPLQISDLINKADTFLDNVNGTLGSVNGLLGSANGAMGHITAAAGNFDSITGKINNGQGSLGALINDPSAYRSIEQAAGSLASATGKILSGQGTLGALINDPSAYQHFNQAAGNLDAITGKINSGQGSLGLLLNDPSAYRNFNQAAGNMASVTGKINSGQGSLGQFVNNPSAYQHFDGAAANLQDDTEALKHSFLLRGFFRKHGYQHQSDLACHSVSQLPPGAPAQRFDYPAASIFKGNQAQLTQTKALDQAGAYLQSHPSSLVVVSAEPGKEGDSDTQRKLTDARAYAARQYLVNHFRLDDNRVKIIGSGKAPGVPPAGGLSILVYGQSGAAAPAPAANGSADRAPR